MILDLQSRLLHCAEQWSAATDRTMVALGRSVANDGKFFDRLQNPKTSCTTSTLENFGHFFADPDNWGDVEITEDALEFVSILGIKQNSDILSTGQSDQSSSRVASL